MNGLFGRARSFLARTLSTYWSYLIVSAAFVVSRVIYRVVFDVTFDARPVTYFIQYIPIWLLKHDFWRSILYLHDQAPLQNVMAGGIWVLLGPSRAAVVLDGLYLVFGYAFGLTLLASIRRLGVPSALATLGVSLLIASPVAVVYESWCFYHLPVVLCFSLALYGLLRHYESGSLRSGIFFFSMLAVAALFRSIYGPLWMAVITAALLVRPPLGARGSRRSPRRTLVLAALAPILVVTANVAKTPLLTGQGMGSGMAWSNIPLKIWDYVPGSERERLQSEHLVSRAPELEAYDTVEGLPPLPVDRVANTGVPLLDMDITPDGQPNPHALSYAYEIEAYYVPDAKYLLKHERQAYVESVVDGFRDWYCSSPVRDIILWRSRNARQLKKLLDRLEGRKSRGAAMPALQIGLPLTFLYGVFRLIRARTRTESERSRTAAILVMLLTIGYEGMGTMLISYGDFSRYRYEVDLFYFAIFAMLVTEVVQALVKVARRAHASSLRRAPVTEESPPLAPALQRNIPPETSMR
jgi:hypothetical protein